MEIKFRRKSEVVTVCFPEGSIPAAIFPRDGFEGIDLTAYTVIYAKFGRSGGRKARELHEKAPRAIVVYEFDWRNGFGEGVLLPEEFNPNRVRFYKSAEQAGAEAEKKREQAAEALREEVIAAIQGVGVRTYFDNGPVVFITPEQEVFANWSVRARSLEEALSGVEKMWPIWREWNERALEAFLRHSGKENPGNGNIELIPSPLGSKRVGVCFDFGKQRYAVFEKQDDGSWIETGTTSYGAPDYR